MVITHWLIINVRIENRAIETHFHETVIPFRVLLSKYTNIMSQ